MNAPTDPTRWRTPARARHLRVEDIDAADRAEASRRRWRRFDRFCIAFGLVSLIYFLWRAFL